TMVSMAVLNAVASLVLQMMQRVAAALWSADVVNALTELDAEGFTNQALQQGGFGLLMTVLIVCAPPMAARFFRGAMRSFMPFSAFGQGQAAASTAHRQVEPHTTGMDRDAFRLATGGIVDETKNGVIGRNDNWANASATLASPDSIVSSRRTSNNPYGLPAATSGLSTDLPGPKESTRFDDGAGLAQHEFTDRTRQAYGAGRLQQASDRTSGIAETVHSEAMERARAGAVFRDAANVFGAKAVTAYNNGNATEGDRFLKYSADYSTESANEFARSKALEATAPKFMVPEPLIRLSQLDPSDTYYLAGAVTGAVVKGSTLQAGIFMNPGRGASAFDFGITWSTGSGWGLDVTASLAAGFSRGPADNLAGSSVSNNVGISMGPGFGQSSTVIDGKVAGGSLSIGVKNLGIPGGTASTMDMTTRTFGYSDIRRFFSELQSDD
ncbi:hypothetical protein QTH97_13700, partial [Variovorax sp. J22R24]|uniref:hypothetical protein n=1 Tax=Variovorax gracilis TaxID=3053502 RepID=UPI002576D08A